MKTKSNFETELIHQKEENQLLIREKMLESEKYRKMLEKEDKNTKDQLKSLSDKIKLLTQEKFNLTTELQKEKLLNAELTEKNKFLEEKNSLNDFHCLSHL